MKWVINEDAWAIHGDRQMRLLLLLLPPSCRRHHYRTLTHTHTLLFSTVSSLKLVYTYGQNDVWTDYLDV